MVCVYLRKILRNKSAHAKNAATKSNQFFILHRELKQAEQQTWTEAGRQERKKHNGN